ncbi:MAG: PIG-L deacetylase family protein [Flavisolibacter sp.]
MLNSKNIIVLAPHTDDGELGCGASIAKYISEGKNVTYVAFSTCSHSLPTGFAGDTLEKECRAAMKMLGVQNVMFFDYQVREFSDHRQEILDQLIKINSNLKPQIVFLPAQHDVHQDHQVIYAEGMRAFKSSNLVGYELPWNNPRFQPVYFEKIEESQMKSKLQSLKEYKSQAHRKYMNEDFIRSLASVRGIQCDTPFAEAFEIYRMMG